MQQKQKEARRRAPDEVERAADKLVEAGLQQRGLGRPAALQPAGRERAPAKLDVADVDDARAADGGRRRVGQVLRLEERLHLRRHQDAVAVGQRQHLRASG